MKGYNIEYLVDKLLFFLFSIEVSLGILRYSMLREKIGFLSSIQEASIILFFVLVIIFKDFTIEQIMLGALLLGVTLLGWHFNGTFSNFLYMSLLMIGGSLLDSKKVLKLSGIVSITTLLFVFCLSKLNIITNLAFWRHGSFWQAFGMYHPLNFAATLLYGLVVLSMASFKNKPNYKWAVVLLIVALFLNKSTEARNDTISLILVALLFCVNLDSVPKMQWITKLALGAVEFLAIIAVFISKIIPEGTEIFTKLNLLFNNRLYYQALLFSNYKIRLFGQNVSQVGLGGRTQAVNDYFYIDSAYTRILFMGGIIFFVTIMYIIGRLVCRLSQLGLYRQAWLIIILLANALTEDTFTYTGLNLLLPVLLCSDQNWYRNFVQKS